MAAFVFNAVSALLRIFSENLYHETKRITINRIMDILVSSRLVLEAR